jgi:hypothetical protein
MTDADQDLQYRAEDFSFAAKSPSARWNLDAIVSELRFSREVSHNIRPKGALRQPPSRDALSRILVNLSAALFPTHYGQSELGRENIDYFVGNTLNSALVALVEQVHRSLLFSGDARSHDEVYHAAASTVRDFAGELPSIRGILVGDVRAAYQGDPAATNLYGILLGYPGTTAIIYHRLAHSLYVRGAPLVARLISTSRTRKPASTFTPAPKSGRISSSITAPASSSAKPRLSANACASIRPSRSGPAASRPTTRAHRQGQGTASDHRRRRRDLCGRDHSGTGHDRPRFDDRRQCLAHPQRAAEQSHLAGADPQQRQRRPERRGRRHLAAAECFPDQI